MGKISKKVYQSKTRDLATKKTQLNQLEIIREKSELLITLREKILACAYSDDENNPGELMKLIGEFTKELADVKRLAHPFPDILGEIEKTEKKDTVMVAIRQYMRERAELERDLARGYKLGRKKIERWIDDVSILIKAENLCSVCREHEVKIEEDSKGYCKRCARENGIVVHGKI